MNEHAEIRELLTLAASGALDADEQRRVEGHLRGCAACKAEFDVWCRITGALHELPTPATPVGLVERTRRQLVNQAAARKERGWNHLVIGCLIVLGWALTFLSWPVMQLLGDKVAQWLDIPFTTVTRVMIVYTSTAWLATWVVAVLLGRHYQREGRSV